MIPLQRYKYILEELNIPIFGVLPRLQKARFKESEYIETSVPVGECSTLIANYVINGGRDGRWLDEDPEDNLEGKLL